MVDCPRDDVRDLLPDLVHDQLEAAARVRVEQHLADCAECAAEVELLRAMRAKAFVTPEVDAERIAAAVRSAMAESSGEMADDGDVVSIAAARSRLGAAPSSARTPAASERAPHRPARRPMPHSWRIAAAIALVAAGAGGYALTRSGSPMLEPSAERASVAAASQSSAPASAPATTPTRGLAKAGAPAPSTAAASDLASAGDRGADAATTAASPLILGDAVNELSESDMQALLQSVDDLQAMPDLEPQQLPLLATIVEGAL